MCSTRTRCGVLGRCGGHMQATGRHQTQFIWARSSSIAGGKRHRLRGSRLTLGASRRTRPRKVTKNCTIPPFSVQAPEREPQGASLACRSGMRNGSPFCLEGRCAGFVSIFQSTQPNPLARTRHVSFRRSQGDVAFSRGGCSEGDPKELIFDRVMHLRVEAHTKTRRSSRCSPIRSSCAG